MSTTNILQQSLKLLILIQSTYYKLPVDVYNMHSTAVFFDSFGAESILWANI